MAILPVGVKIEVCLGHVETVRVVWVTPVCKVEGREVSEEMMDKVNNVLASQEQLDKIAAPQLGQMAVARYSEDGQLYRVRVEEDGMVRFIDFGNLEVIGEGGLYEMPKELEKLPAGAFRIQLDTEETVENSMESMLEVEDSLGRENVFLVLGQAGVGTFYMGEEIIEIFN